MFQTKKRLKERIFDLEKELENERRKNQLAEESGLAKCKGVICRTCEHAIFVEGYWGMNDLVGCDITASCKDYKRRTTKE